MKSNSGLQVLASAAKLWESSYRFPRTLVRSTLKHYLISLGSMSVV